MGQVIKIDNNIVYIGMPDNSIKEVPLNTLNFLPQIGDEVNLFGNEGSYIVTLAKQTPSIPSTQTPMVLQQVIHTQSGTPVNKIAYCLITFFLGGFGIHKFYSGKVGMGILYLIFFWTIIPSIVAFIEFIIAITKKEDSAGNIYV